jgi:hypothetical protein
METTFYCASGSRPSVLFALRLANGHPWPITWPNDEAGDGHLQGDLIIMESMTFKQKPLKMVKQAN